MRGITYVLLGILVVFFKRDEKTFALAAWSIQTQSVPEGYLESLKVEFSKPVVEALLRFGGFHRKFGVPYLYVKSALTYATEIAKATAYSPLFSSSEGIEDFSLKHLLRMVLPCSPVYCTDVNCAATTIGEILAEIITEGGFVTHRVSNHVMKMYAGNLAGNILWRLSRLPDPDSHMSEALADATPDIVDDYAQLLRLLSLGIRNSTLISEFCEDKGIDASTSMTLMKSVCGSRFLNFKLAYARELTAAMLEKYTFARKVLPQDLEFSLAFSVISSIVAETITFSMIKQKFLHGGEDLKETSRDVLKMILLGITTSKMDLGSSDSFVKYSSFKNEKVSKPSKLLKQTVLQTISSELSESDIFQRLFNSSHVFTDKKVEYASAMTAGVTRYMTYLSDELSTAIAERFIEILSKFAEKDPSKNNAKILFDEIAKELFDLAAELKLVDFNDDSSVILDIFHEIVQNVQLSLRKLEVIDSETKESNISDSLRKLIPLPKSIIDVITAITHLIPEW